jgi:integrase
LRIGLLNGKGIEQNTFDKHIQNLTLGLALNLSYSRSSRPLDVNKRLMDLTLQDYESYVRFWCDPANMKSERTSLNYTGAFRRMITCLKVPTPQEFNDLFKMRLTQGTKIVRYDPDLLRIFLQHEDGRVQLISLMCLNFGYYQVDIARLRFEHITDFDGNPYRSGDMFVTKRRERTRHQNKFTTTVYCWPETQRLMEQYRAALRNAYGSYFLSQNGTPYHVKTVAWIVEQAIREHGLGGKFSLKQFRKIGASQIKALCGSDAMHQYKANALGAADQPYILEDFTLLTGALKKFREKLIANGVLTG